MSSVSPLDLTLNKTISEIKKEEQMELKMEKEQRDILE